MDTVSIDIKIVLLIILMYIVIIFFMDRLYKLFNNYLLINNSLKLVRFLMIILPILVFFMLSLYAGRGLDDNFLVSMKHLIIILFAYLLITFLTYLFYDESYRSVGIMSNKTLLFVPFFNIIITIIYFTNFYTNVFEEIDMVGPYFKLIKLDTNFNIFKYIFAYLILESIFILLYVILILNFQEDENVMKTVCSNKSKNLDRKCISVIISDIFMFSMFIKLILVFILMVILALAPNLL